MVINPNINLEQILFEEHEEFSLEKFNLEHLKKLSKFEQIYRYVIGLTHKGTINLIGSGAYRDVYDVHSKDEEENDLVLKLASDPHMTGQNNKEAYAWKRSKNSPVLSKLIAHDEQNFFWVLMQKMDRVFEENECVFALNDFLGLKKNFLKSHSQVGLLLTSLSEDGLVTTSNMVRLAFEELWPNNINIWSKEMIEAIKLCHIDPRDSHCLNWGMKNGQLLLIDYGF